MVLSFQVSTYIQVIYSFWQIPLNIFHAHILGQISPIHLNVVIPISKLNSL